MNYKIVKNLHIRASKAFGTLGVLQVSLAGFRLGSTWFRVRFCSDSALVQLVWLSSAGFCWFLCYFPSTYVVTKKN